MSDFFMAEHQPEIEQCIATIADPTSPIRLTAAQRLNRLGADRLGHSFPRGSPDQAAKNRLPDPGHISVILEAVQTTAGELRCELIFTLMYWGGEESIDTINSCLTNRADVEVTAHALFALGCIGGPKAVQCLRDFIQGTENSVTLVWQLAISALADLRSGGSHDYAEGLVERICPFDF